MASVQKNTVSLLGIPTHWGIGVPAIAEGPRIFRENGIIKKLARAGIEIFDAGDVALATLPHDDTDRKFKHRAQVLDSAKRTAARVKALMSNYRILAIGGDHTLSMGTIAAASSAVGADNLGLIWIDAHGDINTPETTMTGNAHGMPLALLLGLAVHTRPAIHKKNLIHIGGNNFDPPERTLIETIGIQAIEMSMIKKRGLNEVFRAITSLKNRVGNVWVSVDLDAVDAADAPGVMYRNKNGFIREEMIELMRFIANHCNVVGADIAEYHYENDIAFKTAHLGIELAATLFRNS